MPTAAPELGPASPATASDCSSLEGGNSGRVYDTAKGDFLYSVNFSSTANQVRGDLSADGMERQLVVGDRFLYTHVPRQPDHAGCDFLDTIPADSGDLHRRTAADGDFYAYGDAVGTVGVYNLTLAKEVGNYSAHKGVPVLCIAAQGGKSPRVISGGQDKVIVVRTGKTLTTNRRLLGHEGPVTGVSLSRGRQAAGFLLEGFDGARLGFDHEQDAAQVYRRGAATGRRHRPRRQNCRLVQ